MKCVLAMLFAAAFAVRPLPRADGPLEPSIQNEVDHALDRAAAWLGRHADTNALPQDDLFKTNGLPRERISLRPVSAQRGAGWGLTPTNAAPPKPPVEILKGL